MLLLVINLITHFELSFDTLLFLLLVALSTIRPLRTALLRP
jgi:hypothetical protein